jgi:rhodanese-related sulfurtransferase
MRDKDPHIGRTLPFSVVTIVVLLVLLLLPFKRSADSISVERAHELLGRDSSIVVLDVRSREEFMSETGRLPRAQLIPVEELEGRIDELSPFKHHAILVYCRSGRRSRNATTLLVKHEFKAMNIEGGILEWKKAGFSVLLEKKQ